MAKYQFFKTEFDKLATDGFIGHPDGEPAYAYIRVSSDEQGEEGRSGLPRQIEHVHEKAFEQRRRIPWDMVFADDFTGFELERPELSRLRREYRSPQRRADAVVMEHLDRLSRNADWHQGFLLDEMKQLHIAPLFWKSFHSRIERAVMGAVAQEGMERSKQIMMEGTLRKARDGRVTARTPAYGLKLVDEHGREGERAKRFTYYALHEDEAAVMRQIYQRIASGESLRKVASDLDTTHIPPPKRTKFWTNSTLGVLIKNPVYKGEFIAHRWIDVKIQKPTKDGLSTRIVTHRQQRPEDEWIHVQVPAIVDAGLWQAANDMLAKNKLMAKRNAGESYLLTGLIKCATCEHSWIGITRRSRKGKICDYRIYRCPNTYVHPRYIRETVGCHQSIIQIDVLDAAVWEVVCTARLEPQVLVSALEADMLGEQNAQLERQIAYLEHEIEEKQTEDDKLYKAYMADVFDENEYAARRALLKDERARLYAELERLRPLRATRERFEAQKALILDFAERVRSLNAHADPPFEIKQRIIKMTVNRIVLDSHAKTFHLEGAIRGEFPIVNILVGRA